MSFKAILEIEDKKFNILEFKYNIHQPVDKSGYPSGIPMGGEILIKLESDKDTFFYNWTSSPEAQKKGTITFFNRDGMSKMRELKFREAYCVLHHEQFTNSGKQAMQFTIAISPGNANYNGTDFTKSWSKPQFDSKNASTFVKEEEDKEKKVVIKFEAKGNEKNVKFGFDEFDENFRKNYTGKKIADLENEYKPIQVYGEKYFPIWVSMRKGQTISLQIDESKKKNYKLFNEIKLEHPDFTFEPANLKDAKEVHITCNNTGKEAQIKVEADGDTVGAINIFYPEPKEIKVRWVVVDFNKKDKKAIKGIIDNKEVIEAYLKKAFYTMLLDTKIVNKDAEILDIVTEVTDPAEKTYIEGIKKLLIEGTNDSAKKDDESRTKLISNLHSLHKTRQKTLNSDEIYLYLTNLKSSWETEDDKGNTFTSSNNGGTVANVCMMFLGNNDKYPKVEIPHEIMHAAGLPHTFIDKDKVKPKKHTFGIAKTNNFMDYSKSKESTFYWQWVLLH